MFCSGEARCASQVMKRGSGVGGVDVALRGARD